MNKLIMMRGDEYFFLNNGTMQYFVVLNIFLYYFFTFDLGLTGAMKFCLFLNCSNDKKGFETAEGFDTPFHDLKGCITKCSFSTTIILSLQEKRERIEQKVARNFLKYNGFGHFYVLNYLLYNTFSI